jgi:hypothetical protein
MVVPVAGVYGHLLLVEPVYPVRETMVDPVIPTRIIGAVGVAAQVLLEQMLPIAWRVLAVQGMHHLLPVYL